VGKKGLEETDESHRFRSRSALLPRIDSMDEQQEDENRADRPDWLRCTSAVVNAIRQPSVALPGTRMNVGGTEVAQTERPFRACVEDASNVASASWMLDTACPKDTQAQELSFAQWGWDAAMNGVNGTICSTACQSDAAGEYRRCKHPATHL